MLFEGTLADTDHSDIPAMRKEFEKRAKEEYMKKENERIRREEASMKKREKIKVRNDILDAFDEDKEDIPTRNVNLGGGFSKTIIKIAVMGGIVLIVS